MGADALHNLCLADPVWAERYEGWTELGHGGSATVVRTHARALGEDIALKVFPRLAREEWARFRQEVSTAQRLTSPYIVRTYSPFPRAGFAWIELELIEGPDLRQELERRAAEGTPFAHDEAIEVGLAVSRALATAHEAGVTHRDVKPANILLPRSGRPAAKLGDFGISRLAGAARLTSTGLLVGTPQFAAPEVVGGEQAGPAADVYSFTLCLYLMLSGGRAPFAVEDEVSPAHWLRAHATERPRPITDFDASVPPALAGMLARGLSKEPDLRPTASEWTAALEAMRAPQVSVRPPRTRPARRALMGAGLTGGMLAVVGSLAWWTAGPSARPVPAATAVAQPARPAAAVEEVPAPSVATIVPPPVAPVRWPRASASAVPRPAATVAPAKASSPRVPEPTPPAVVAPSPEPPQAEAASTTEPAVPVAPRAAAALHLDGLLRARAVPVGRREGLPGQREMVLVDALHGEEWIWFRFTLEGGASLRIARVFSQLGDLTTWVQEPAGDDLRVVVQVPRSAVSRRARLSLEVGSGPTYTFALGSRSLGRFLKELFR